MPEPNDSGELLRQIVELATGEVKEIGEYVKTIDTCLRGDMAGKTVGLISRMTAIEGECRKNHGINGNRQVPVPSATTPPATNRQVVWTVDKIITAILTGVALLAGSFGALTSTCNQRDYRRESRRWRNPAAIPHAPSPHDSGGP